MNHLAIARIMFASTIFATASIPGWSQGEGKAREVAGSVRDSHDKALKKAVVQLENHDTQAVETYITDADGSFHFKRLLSDTDYEIWATYQSQISKKVFLSKFNDKANVALRLVINVGP